MCDRLPAAGSSSGNAHSTRRNFSVAAILRDVGRDIGRPGSAEQWRTYWFRPESGGGTISSRRETSRNWFPDVPLEVAFRRNRVDGWRVVSEKSTAWVVKFPGYGM